MAMGCHAEPKPSGGDNESASARGAKQENKKRKMIKRCPLLTPLNNKNEKKSLLFKRCSGVEGGDHQHYKQSERRHCRVDIVRTVQCASVHSTVRIWVCAVLTVKCAAAIILLYNSASADR